ncbi:uncharacterized protein DNG_04298 [Cephalotrichum gorgonifer]|uniref:Uncharacterized protein n=1 Tax=Cephalotrichum gorgonifer TaxID=2041049 RepID=A0AAE8MWI5_9PEZI|nr:uncharacterized protein DNG_04298 [Cephalotrichum gorgonifer]
MKTPKETPVPFVLLLGLHGAVAQIYLSPKGSETWLQTPQFWGTEPEAVEKWQSYLAQPDATGTFILPGFNLSQPWYSAEPLDWTIKIAIKANMIVPESSEAANNTQVTGGMVWLEPPDGLVTSGNNYTANEEWNPFSLYFTTNALDDPNPGEPLTPFFHRDPGDDRPTDGTCKGILADECIEYIEREAESDYLNNLTTSHVIQSMERCPAISGVGRQDLRSPFNLTRRAQGSSAAMKYNEGCLASFTSGAHAQQNDTAYATHGSQYVPILFRWMKADTGNTRADEPMPKGPISKLMCISVKEAAEGKKLPDPGEEYLMAVEDKEGTSKPISLVPIRKND